MAKITGTTNADLLLGTVLDDLIIGMEGDDTLMGDDGNDDMRGGFGNDVLHGESGDDSLAGSSGDDSLFGDAGNDTLSGGSGNDLLDGGNGTDIIDGGAGDDVILGGSSDTITGGAGFDTLDYSAWSSGISANLNTHVMSVAGANSMADGIEKVVGTAFNDILNGDSGANVLVGGAGDDVLRGRAGADTLTGGLGHDTYVFMQKDVMVGGLHQGVDFITDFGSGDAVDLRDFFKGAAPADYNDVMAMTFDGVNTTLSVKTGGVFADVVAFAGDYGTNPAGFVDDNIFLV